MTSPKRSRWTFTSPGPGLSDDRGNLRAWSYQATITGAGQIGATVHIEVRNGDGPWELFGTLSPSGTNSASDQITGVNPWDEHRARCAAISGVDAACVVFASGGV